MEAIIIALIVLINGFLLMVNADIMVFNNNTRHQIEVEFRDMPALFGGIIPQDGIDALAVYADPPEACTPIAPPPSNVTNYTGRWAVIIKRYNCSFDAKVRAAQKANYQFAIVHNVNSSDLEAMSSENPRGIYIPSVFVGETTGHLLRDNYSYHSGYFIVIDDNSPDINKHLLVPFAIVVGICFFIMLGFMVVKCIQDRRRARRHRLPTSSLRKIPTAKFQKGDPYDTCAICIEDFVEGDKLRILPCSHAYHSKCIDPWLTRNRRVCPICKRKVFAAGEKPPAGGSSGSDSDTDGVIDDRTPLVLPSGRNTQGGTFDNLSENPLMRQGPPLWRRHSFSSASTNSDYVNTTSNSSVNSHVSDIETDATTATNTGFLSTLSNQLDESNVVPGNSILPSNGVIQQPPSEESNERSRSRWFFLNLFD
ncbi:E3 ubiquitin-protein ligase RNF13-like isoform X2 [Lycorma delicatula]|uniref:E3 ubiquitin-protein ligase RNF13-like isoform X2 n=1 Tax=Lycorma delicatula TaxID=130591 RepID=UPI003F5131FE